MFHDGTVKTEELTRKRFTRCRTPEAVEAKSPEKVTARTVQNSLRKRNSDFGRFLSDARHI
jgi:hypothetical protein